MHNFGKDFKVSWRKVTALKINLRWDVIIKHLQLCVVLQQKFHSNFLTQSFCWRNQELSTAKWILLKAHTFLSTTLPGFWTFWVLFLVYVVLGSLSCSGKLCFVFRGYTVPCGIEWNCCCNLMQLFISVFNTVKLKYIVIIELLVYHDYKINK